MAASGTERTLLTRFLVSVGVHNMWFDMSSDIRQENWPGMVRQPQGYDLMLVKGAQVIGNERGEM